MPMDIKHMSRNGAPPEVGEASAHNGSYWWKAKKDDVANEVTSALTFMKENQSNRLTQWVVSSRLYGNMAIVGRNGLSFSRVAAAQPWLKERMSWNVVQASADTVTSKMIKNKPKPMFLTSGGDYKLQRKAKKLNQFIEGVFYENDAHKMGGEAFLDACVWGDGIIHVYELNGRVKFERVIASELWVDDMDGFYGEPRSLHRCTDLDRGVLLALAESWLAKEKDKDREAVLDKIRRAKASKPDESPGFLADKVAVAESWHLPSCEGADDGRHTITIADCCIVDEKWEHTVFPFAKLPWAPRRYGYWAQGLAEQLQNIQFEINTLLQTIKQSFWKGGTFRVFLPTGSRLVKEQITNQIGAVVSYTGDKAPVIVTPPLVQQEIFQHLLTLWGKAFEQAGVSTMAASSVKPAGLNSGKALREFNDIQTDRFMKIGQAYERFFLDLARLAIMVVKGITKRKGSYKVKVPQRGNVMKEIDWKDVNLTEDQYVMRCFPVSSLPQDPAGRMESVVEMVQNGWINQRQGRRLLDFPDLEAAEGLANAAEDYLSEVFENMLYADEEETPEYVAPEPYDDLQLARELALEHYQRGKVQHVPDDRLELLRRFMQDLDGLEMAAQAKMQAQQGAPPGGPGAPAGGPPGAPPGGPQGAPAGTPSATPPPAPVGELMPNAAIA